MIEFDKILQDQARKITLLEEFVSLNLRKKTILPELKELDDKMSDVKELVLQTNQVMDKYRNGLADECEKLSKKLQKQQMTLANVLHALEKKEKSDGKNLLCVPKPGCRETQTLTTPLKSRGQNYADQTPRMYVSDYEKSPFVSKVRPVSLQFLDFEISVSIEQFDEIPKYIKGRETLDELNNFLDTILIPCFTEKYQLLHRKRDCLRNMKDIEMWKLYREQQSYVPGCKFITQGDISRRIQKLMDKKMCGKIVMLRHLGILQEQRIKSTVCYVWLN